VLATARGRSLEQARGRADLVADFCEPLAGDIACMTAGLLADEWQRLLSLSARANAPVLVPGRDHAIVDAGRQELYRFCAPIISRHRAAREQSRRTGQHPEPTLISLAVAVMDDQGMPENETVKACSTIIGGLPSIVPVLTMLAFGSLRRPGVLDQCRADPGLLPAAVWEHLRHTAHFTFALPGRATRTIDLGRFTVPAGANVLPVIRAAHRDPSHAQDPAIFDLSRPRRAILAFGAGVHVCLGKALTLVSLEEALRALAGLRPGLRLAAGPDSVTWRFGLMPTPGRIPVLTAAPAEMAACAAPHNQPG
jgi:cytochrome P450